MKKFKIVVLSLFILISFSVILPILTFLGSSLLLTSGVEYYKELKIKKHNTVSVDAVVTDVRQEFKKKDFVSYLTVNYEYNGQEYTSELEYSVYSENHQQIGGIAEHKKTASMKAQEKANKDRQDSERNQLVSDDWDDIQSLVDTETEVFIDPDSPGKAAIPSEDKVVHALRNMTLAGILASVLAIAVLFTDFVMFKKIIKTVKELRFDSQNNASEIYNSGEKNGY